MGLVWRMPGAKPGVHTGNILKGCKPADLPVQQAVKFELITNRGTSMLLGIEMPPQLLAIADEVTMQLSVNAVVGQCGCCHRLLQPFVSVDAC
jgi:ABC transporter substrate binding protein